MRQDTGTHTLKVSSANTMTLMAAVRAETLSDLHRTIINREQLALEILSTFCRLSSQNLQLDYASREDVFVFL